MPPGGCSCSCCRARRELAQRARRELASERGVSPRADTPDRAAARNGERPGVEERVRDGTRDRRRRSVASTPARATARLTKSQRQHRIVTLLARHAVSNQAQVVDLLAEQGVHATQGTVSRDLEELGAVKIRTPQGELAYAIPALPMEQQAPPEHLRRVFGEWVVAVDWSANLVVVRTPPGSAHVVGSALDRAGLADVVGTVAGDDTVLVVATEEAGGAKVAQWLSGLAGGHTTPRSPTRGQRRSRTRGREQGR